MPVFQGTVDQIEHTKNKITTIDPDTATDEQYPSAAAVAVAVAGKVDKADGKGLSTNDYTDSDKAEVAKIAGKLDRSLTKLIIGSPDNIDSLPTENGKSAYYYSDTAFGMGGTLPSDIGRLDGFVLKEHRRPHRFKEQDLCANKIDGCRFLGLVGQALLVRR